MYVRAFLLCDLRRLKSLAGRMAPLFDTRRRDLQARDFWQDETYFTHPARAKAVVIAMRPVRHLDKVALGRAAARLLEARHGLVLDWAGGVRESGVWLITKTLAADAAGAGRNREFRLDREDLAALRGLAPGGRWPGERDADDPGVGASPFLNRPGARRPAVRRR